MKIDRFTGELSFLSNFYRCKVELYGITFPSSEHAYMWHKCEDPNYKRLILECDTPGKAKRLGRSCQLVPNWEQIKFDVMGFVVYNKFLQNPKLKYNLMDTWPIPLEEGNTWGDTVWGVCKGKGTNWFGIILMNIRQHFVNAPHHQPRHLFWHAESDSYVTVWGQEELEKIYNSTEPLDDVTGMVQHERTHQMNIVESQRAQNS